MNTPLTGGHRIFEESSQIGVSLAICALRWSIQNLAWIMGKKIWLGHLAKCIGGMALFLDAHNLALHPDALSLAELLHVMKMDVHAIEDDCPATAK